jgi:septal ring factor EnvC (AmiA/AmiB activator)
MLFNSKDKEPPLIFLIVLFYSTAIFAENALKKSAGTSSSSSSSVRSDISEQPPQRHQNSNLKQKQIENAERELQRIEASFTTVKHQCNVIEDGGGKISKPLRDQRNKLEGKSDLPHENIM